MNSLVETAEPEIGAQKTGHPKSAWVEGFSTQVLECSGDLSSNPNQTVQNKFITVFRITCKLQTEVFN